MGLHKTAHYLKSKGRGNDTMLVHMTPGEVKGLQSLAMSAGGSLTINPETGLPEAGFLERMLPMVIGAGLAATGVGAPVAALMVGGGYGLATGSVEKGLMAGLGAYGGAGLASGLASAGTSAAVEAGGQAAVEQAVTATGQEAAKEAIGSQITEEAIKNAALEGTTLPANYAQMAAQQATPQQIAGIQAQNALANNPALQQAASQAANPLDVVRASGMGNVANSAQVVNPTVGQSVSSMGRGVGELGTSAGRSAVYEALPTGTLPAAVSPFLIQDQQGAPAGYTEDEYDRYLKGYKLSPDYKAYEAPRPNPYYSAQYASGGIASLQGGGGPVERMSMMNTAMNPQGGLYPQGMIDKTQYATPTQRPVSAELMTETPAYERSSPMLMASGGIARYAPGGQINLQGTVNLNQGNMASQASPGAATVGSGMAPSTISPMSLPFMGMPATGGPGMGPQNHMYQPQLAVMPQQSMASGGIARYRNRGQVNVLQDYVDRQERQQQANLPRTAGIPDVGIFRDTDVDTARKDALTAAMIRLGKAGKGAGIKPIALPKTAIKGLGDIRGATPEIEGAAAGGTMRYNLGGYSDGGRMLKGPGDGMSDSIPASIAGKQPARLADGEFVVPADVVSHLGNGSTDAGAKKLYGMMNKIRKARTGKKKQAPAVKAAKYMPV